MSWLPMESFMKSDFNFLWYLCSPYFSLLFLASGKRILRFFLPFHCNSHISSQNLLVAFFEVLHFISTAQIFLFLAPPQWWIMNQANIIQKASYEQPSLILFSLLLAISQFLWPLCPIIGILIVRFPVVLQTEVLPP